RGKDFALFFAVDNYKSIRPLKNPIENSEAIAKILKDEFGFQVEIIRNPTQMQIENKLKEYKNNFDKLMLDEDAQLFISFSGHGMEELREGYFLAQDSNPNDLYHTAVPYNYWRKFINTIDCPHILVAVDACYSAFFDPNWQNKSVYQFKRPGELSEGEKLLKKHKKTKSRLFFTSDGKGDQTPDKSSFAKKFQEGLMSEVGNDKILTSSDIFATLSRAFPSPHRGEFGDDEAGSSFLFFKKSIRRAQISIRNPGVREKENGKTDLDNQFLLPIMIPIPEGYFQMGSNETDYEKPIHKVYIKSFSLSKTEISNKQFCVFLNAKGNQNEGGTNWLNIKSNSCKIRKSGNQYFPVAGFDEHPVVEVSWYGAVAYCNWLSEVTGETYRLPSEAEWEYAAGGGTGIRTKWAGTNLESNLRSFANFKDKGGSDQYLETAPVGSFSQNSLRLFDMSANTWEWCEDKWHQNYNGAPTNGSSWINGTSTKRILRGGSWDDTAPYLRVVTRNYNDASAGDSRVGFRPARTS
ncbi:MAG: SUMF1/EgtB/PvdO family nonheme iron enzyme, partial [Bacteroidota bacterium]